ncbi:hypothetical protein [Streptomyces sp. FH025]|uniref:hypothetical protein n=1 Tax=Streptomyces sp. FH025 TaxID=2815937 RepID=UPI001A9F7A1D|nr:hypothetical protein [Streptomyces sp. FH025]MBO1415651.1 hypothetical protein [Streptomyces sp. FH025]
MVDHPELLEDVTEALVRAGFDTAPGSSPLRIDRHAEGVVVGWSPGEGADGPPSGSARAAVRGAVAVVLREHGFLVTGTGEGELLVRCAEPVTVPPEPEVAPEQWWG